jgi:RNA polymerase sigma factor (sigma-70 family)
MDGTEMDRDRGAEYTGRATANPATALILGLGPKSACQGLEARYGSLTSNHISAGNAAGQDQCRGSTNPARDGQLVTDLVTRAKTGDKPAWDALVERYAPLIWSICVRYRLSRADAEDVGQNVWLCLVDQLDKIRDPAALPGWLATTARRECGQVLRTVHGPRAPAYLLDAGNLPDQQAGTVDQDLLVAERHAALREALTHLPVDGQQLIALLIADPPIRYAEISARLGIPVGSIGPNRSRCLDKLRRDPAIAALINPPKPPDGQQDARAVGRPGK